MEIATVLGIAALSCFIIGILCAFGIITVGDHKVGTQTITTVNNYSYKNGSSSVEINDIKESNNYSLINILRWAALALILIAVVLAFSGLLLLDY